MCRKFQPQLLGRNAVELGIAEMISTVQDSWPTDRIDIEGLIGLLGAKAYLAGPNPTFIDFCVFESLSNFEGLLPDTLAHYKQRMLALGEPVMPKPSSGSSKML